MLGKLGCFTSIVIPCSAAHSDMSLILLAPRGNLFLAPASNLEVIIALVLSGSGSCSSNSTSTRVLGIELALLATSLVNNNIARILYSVEFFSSIDMPVPLSRYSNAK